MEQITNSSESIIPSLPSFDKNVHGIYFLANSPASLYRMLRSNYFVQQLATLNTNVLIDEFDKRVSEPVSTSSEVAEVYAIFVSLTFKERKEVEIFFTRALDIKFEWFSDLAKMYLDDPKVMPSYQTISVSVPILNSTQSSREVDVTPKVG